MQCSVVGCVSGGDEEDDDDGDLLVWRRCVGKRKTINFQSQNSLVKGYRDQQNTAPCVRDGSGCLFEYSSSSSSSGFTQTLAPRIESGHSQPSDSHSIVRDSRP